MYMDWHGWGMGGGWLFMLLFWGLVVALIAGLMIRIAGKRRDPASHGESAMDILKKRYAKGEITREEYESVKKDITGQ